jgi:hypothetical protein
MASAQLAYEEGETTTSFCHGCFDCRGKGIAIGDGTCHVRWSVRRDVVGPDAGPHCLFRGDVMDRVEGCVHEGVQICSEPLYVFSRRSAQPGPMKVTERDSK